jgi:hypothetical protein
VEALSKIEEVTAVRYHTLFREWLSQFLKIWEQDKPRIIKPFYPLLINYEQALKMNKIGPEGIIKPKKKGGKYSPPN